jgi:hypothetical protein
MVLWPFSYKEVTKYLFSFGIINESANVLFIFIPLIVSEYLGDDNINGHLKFSFFVATYKIKNVFIFNIV